MSGSVTFLTLFLNLMTGTFPVTVAVEGDVTQVDLLLDGELIGRMTGEPWTLDCDFGHDLEPHELVAVGRDSRGREIARAKQLINLPRPRAEARLALLDDGADPPQRARLTWSTVENLAPRSIEVLFDDRPVSLRGDREIELPPYDPRRTHFLTARLTFAGELEATAIASFGGAVGTVLNTELTALPIVSVRARQTPSRREMAGTFYKDDRRLPVFAVEKNAADLLVVVDRRAWTALREIADSVSSSFVRRGDPAPFDGLPPGLRKGDRLRFVATAPQHLRDAEPPRWLFPIGPDLNAGRKQAIASILLRTEAPAGDEPQRIADAVAVAARTAVTGERPRAVVLILAEGFEDASGVPAATVRGYLRKLRVPLHLWLTYPPENRSPWGEGLEVTRLGHLRTAIKQLRRSLDRQHVVWLEGSHLPQDVELRHDGWKIAG